MIRTFKYRIRPNQAQDAALTAMLGDCCALYNACLEQRISAYRRKGLSLRYGDQAAELDTLDQGWHANRVKALPRQQFEPHQIAQRVGQRQDLGRQAAARLADGLAFSPPFAPCP